MKSWSALVGGHIPWEMSGNTDDGVLFTRRDAGYRSLPARRDDGGLLLHKQVETLRGEVHDLPGVCGVKIDPLRLRLRAYLLDPRLKLGAEPPLLVF